MLTVPACGHYPSSTSSTGTFSTASTFSTSTISTLSTVSTSSTVVAARHSSSSDQYERGRSVRRALSEQLQRPVAPDRTERPAQALEGAR